MRVQCDGCESAEAVVVCCADEAALCRECDIQVHDANKLAGKHHRVPLFRPPNNTNCDICQEKTAYFFCVEDRALLCHNCDVSIHKLTATTSNHRRFLVTGVAASLHTVSGPAPAASPGTPPAMATKSSSFPSKTITSSASGTTKTTSSSARNATTRRDHRDPATAANALANAAVALESRRHCSQGSPQASTSTTVPQRSQVFGTRVLSKIPPPATTANHIPATVIATPLPAPPAPPPPPGDASRKTSIFEFLTEAVPGWKCDELLGFSDTSVTSSYTIDPVTTSSKMDVNSSWPSNVFSDQIYSRSVPQMDKLPTGLNTKGAEPAMKPRTKQDIFFLPEPDDAFLVPDLGFHSTPELPPAVKRRRTYCELDNIFLS